MNKKIGDFIIVKKAENSIGLIQATEDKKAKLQDSELSDAPRARIGVFETENGHLKIEPREDVRSLLDKLGVEGD